MEELVREQDSDEIKRGDCEQIRTMQGVVVKTERIPEVKDENCVNRQYKVTPPVRRKRRRLQPTPGPATVPNTKQEGQSLDRNTNNKEPKAEKDQRKDNAWHTCEYYNAVCDIVLNPEGEEVCSQCGVMLRATGSQLDDDVPSEDPEDTGDMQSDNGGDDRVVRWKTLVVKTAHRKQKENAG